MSQTDPLPRPSGSNYHPFDAVDLEGACSAAIKAAKQALKDHGIDRPAVVLTFAWKDADGDDPWVVGSAVPKAHRKALAESLYESAMVASGHASEPAGAVDAERALIAAELREMAVSVPEVQTGRVAHTLANAANVIEGKAVDSAAP